MTRPVYEAKPIRSVAALCRALATPEGLLRDLTQRIPQLYVGPKPKLKKDGKSYRFVYDTKPPLKPLLKRVNRIIFERISFPQFLQGSLKGRDYVSNVEIHQGSRVVISEDIEKYFDNITADHVFHVWANFFKFGQSPAELLTSLTTREGRVFQGTPTSSYLANLAFWDIEEVLVEKLAGRGLRYSRYVDDVTISSPVALPKDDKSWAIAQVIAMMGSRGFRAARSKHAIQSGGGRISVMNLNVNRTVGLPAKERSNIRVMVYQLEQSFARGETGPEFRRGLDQASGRIGRMRRFHAEEAATLRNRILDMRKIVDVESVRTGPSTPLSLAPMESSDGDDPPF